MRRRALALALGLAAALAPPARADEPAEQVLDWQVREAPAGPFVDWLRGARDGALGLCDDVLDLQLGVFAELALDAGSALELGSDAVGLIDDNPVTQHVFKATASRPLAQSAWLFHRAGAEALLGSHGMAEETWLAHSISRLNPLLDADPPTARLPLDPLAFVGEGLVHGEVYAARIPGSVLVASLVADVAVRPFGNLVRIVGFHRAADRIEAAGKGLVRRTVH